MPREIRITLSYEAERIFSDLGSRGLNESQTIASALWLLDQAVQTNRVALLKESKKVHLADVERVVEVIFSIDPSRQIVEYGLKSPNQLEANGPAKESTATPSSDNEVSLEPNSLEDELHQDIKTLLIELNALKARQESIFESLRSTDKVDSSTYTPNLTEPIDLPQARTLEKISEELAQDLISDIEAASDPKSLESRDQELPLLQKVHRLVKAKLSFYLDDLDLNDRDSALENYSVSEETQTLSRPVQNEDLVSEEPEQSVENEEEVQQNNLQNYRSSSQ